uniref:non-ribosomal peptide synthetase n=1 Tax=Falsiroseomonas oryziterrae TaxID=2911368 RepID=UPI001F1C1DF5
MNMQRRPDTGETLWTPASLLGALAARGDLPALFTMEGDSARPWAGGALAEDGFRFAAGLRNAGLSAEEPIGLYAPNSPRWVAARLGLGAAGALAVAVDDLAPEAEAVAILRNAGCTRVLASRAHAEALRTQGLATGFTLVLLEDDAGAEGWRALMAESAGAPPPEPAPDAPAMLVYTSGTTGAPKGFALTHANLNANLHGILAQGLIGEADRMLVPLPLHHVYPFLVGLMSPIAAGSAVAFPETVTGPGLVAALKGTRATVMVGVPRLYTALVAGLEGRVAARGAAARTAFAAMLRLSRAARRRDVFLGRRLFASLHAQLAPELKLMVSGGARLEEEASWKLEALGWRLLNGYGLAETASLFTGNVPTRQRIGSEGQPVAAGSAIRIVAPDTTRPLPPGAEGEIQLRGRNVFAGYRDNPDANAAAFTPDGWFRSGDLGHLDADGFVFVTGRLKEMIVLGGGKNVFPEPLERHYTRGPVKEIAVLERAGALVAVVLPDTTAIRAPNARTVEDALRVALAEAANEVPSFQRLAGFVVAREPLPRTRLGKIQRFRLPTLYEELRSGAAPREAAAHSPEDLALLAAPGAKEAWAILRARDPSAPEPSLDAHPGLDLGMDSLAWVGVALELESRLGVRLSEEEIAGFATLRDLLRHVAQAGAAPAAAPAV